MTVNELEILVAYDVTAGSTDGTINKGDIIWFSENRMLNSGRESGFLTEEEWNQPKTNDFEIAESTEYCVVRTPYSEGLQKKSAQPYYEYKERWDELEMRLMKAERELLEMKQANAKSEKEQVRLSSKLSGLRIALGYMHEYN